MQNELKNSEKIDQEETLFFVVVTGFLVALVSFAISNFLAGPKFFTSLSYTNDFIRLSLDPFPQNNQLQYRFFVPLIGYLTGLKGQFYFIISLIGTVFFLIMVNWWTFNLYKSKWTSFYLTSCMAFLPVVLFNNTIYGWSDIFCYSFLLLALMNPEYCFFGIFFGILSHELFFVYLPFIVLYYLRFHPNFFKDDDRLIRVGLCLLVMFLLYTLIRLWITSHHTTAWTVQHYVSLLPKRGFFYELKSQPLLAGFFSSYEMSFILIFPFLYFLIRNVKRKVLDILLLLSALFPALLLFVVHDTTRFWSITFIFILLFPFYLNRMRNRLLVIILIGNLLIPTFYFGSDWRAPLDRQADFIFSKVTARKNGEKDFAKAIYDFNIPSLIKQMLDP